MICDVKFVFAGSMNLWPRVKGAFCGAMFSIALTQSVKFSNQRRAPP